MKIAVAQPLVIPGDVAENLRRLRPLVREADRRGAAMVVFSECGLTGFDHAGAGIRAAIPLDDPALTKIAALARRYRLAIVTGFYERAATGIFNTAVAFLPNGRRVVQRKHNIVQWELATQRVTAAPRQRHIFRYRGLRFGMLICADAGTPGIFGDLETQQCDAVLMLTAGLGDAAHGFQQRELADPRRREEYVKAAGAVCFVAPLVENAVRHGFAVVACNQSGYRRKYFQPGHSVVVNRTGEITALIPGRYVFEHLRPDLAVGFIEGR